MKRRKRIIHDWRNLGSEEAKVALEIEPAARFEEMIRNFFGLAGRQDQRQGDAAPATTRVARARVRRCRSISHDRPVWFSGRSSGCWPLSLTWPDTAEAIPSI